MLVGEEAEMNEFWDRVANLSARARARGKDGKVGSSVKQPSGSHRAARRTSSSPMSKPDCCQPR